MPTPPRTERPVRMLPRLLLAALMLLAALPAFAQPRIGIATMQPGEVFFERFGHNAIVVDDPAVGTGPISYNFGAFDPQEPDFIGRFVRGRMRYMLAALPLELDLAYYREVGRGVRIQWLDLDASQARTLADALAENAKPENARYRYDYFLDNCSTRVRDALDAALGGELRTQLSGRSRGNTFRGDAVRLASPAPWMWLGFDLGLGPAADRPNSLWQDAFVPMRLADALDTFTRADGRPLVIESVDVVAHALEPEPAESPRRWWPWLLAGLALAFGVHLLGRHAPARLARFALPFWLVCGVLGLLMLYLWGFTAHQFAWANRNLLLFTPLCLLLLPGGWRIMRGHAPGTAFHWIAWSVTLGTVVALFLYWLPTQPQSNLPWIVLLLPVHAVLAMRLARNPQ